MVTFNLNRSHAAPNMNKHDEDNLRFLLTVSPETLRDWYNSVSQDDIDYAKELLDAAEINMGLLIEPIQYDEKIDCSVAKQYLTKFTLKGTK